VSSLRNVLAFDTCFAANGSIDSTVLLAWLKAFARTVAKRPLLLVLDNHVSRYSTEIFEFCRSEQIHLLALPPHTTSVLQVLDVAIFSPFKHYARLLRLMAARTVTGVSRANIIRIVSPALVLACSVANILNGFRRCGIFPFNPEAIRQSDLDAGRAKFVPHDQPVVESASASSQAVLVALSEQSPDDLKRALARQEEELKRVLPSRDPKKELNAVDKIIEASVLEPEVCAPPLLPPVRKKKPTIGGVRTEYDSSRGRLLTSDDMQRELESARKEKQDILDQKAETNAAKAEKKAANQAKRAEKAKGVAERKTARLEKAAQRAANKRAGPKRVTKRSKLVVSSESEDETGAVDGDAKNADEEKETDDVDVDSEALAEELQAEEDDAAAAAKLGEEEEEDAAE